MEKKEIGSFRKTMGQLFFVDRPGRPKEFWWQFQDPLKGFVVTSGMPEAHTVRNVLRDSKQKKLAEQLNDAKDFDYCRERCMAAMIVINTTEDAVKFLS